MMNLGRLTLGFFVHSGRKKNAFLLAGHGSREIPDLKTLLQGTMRMSTVTMMGSVIESLPLLF